ncbi:MazG-like pyrophosphatase [Pseudomonas phage 4P]|nr:MazG-like pyrophosphatase [Pseudomonas phage 4P]
MNIERIINRELHDLVVKWGSDRNLIKGSSAKDQFLKLVEEFAEVYEAYAQDNIPEMKDGIGDVMVVATIMAAQLGENLFDHLSAFTESGEVHPTYGDDLPRLGDLAGALARGNHGFAIKSLVLAVMTLFDVTGEYDTTMLACYQAAYDTIKDRKGVMYDGVFIKESDERYASIMAELNRANETI